MKLLLKLSGIIVVSSAIRLFLDGDKTFANLTLDIGASEIVIKEGDTLKLGIKKGNFGGQTSGSSIVLNTSYKGTVAHEMTHFMQNTFFNGQNAGFLQEGLADLTEGGSANTLYASNADELASHLSVTDYGTGDSYYYSVGYMFYRYFAKQAADNYDSLKSYAWTDNSNIVGTSKAELLTGNGENQTISGGAGNDTITVYGKNSKFYGDAGNDYIAIGKTAESVNVYGGAGADSIANHGTNVTVNGDADNDSITNDGENVLINAGAGNDSIINRYAENVSISGGDGNDTLTNSGSNSSIDGGKGDYLDWNTYYNNSGSNKYDDENGNSKVAITGGEGNDSIYNRGNNVTIEGGAGDDYINNSAQNVLYKYTPGDGNDTIYGYTASDTILIASRNYSTTSGSNANDVVINVGKGSILLKSAKGKTLNIETVSNPNETVIYGTNNDDTITNADENAAVDALAGNDVIINKVSANDSSINAGVGKDTIYNSGENVTLYASSGNDIISLSSDAKNNTVQYASGDGNDTIYGFSADDTLQISGVKYSKSVSGNDVIVKVGTDTITLKDAASFKPNIDGEMTVGEVIDNSIDSKKITTDEGNDSIVTSGNYVTVESGEGDDTISGGNNRNKIFAGNGDDVIFISYNHWYSTIDGGAGNDFIKGDNYRNSINGGAGNDTIQFTGINGLASRYINTVKARTGNDSISQEYHDKRGYLYQYASGDGNDTIYGLNMFDTIHVTSGSYSVETIGNNFVVKVGTGSIVVQDVFENKYNKIKVKDSAGKLTTYNDWSIMSGTSGADSLYNEMVNNVTLDAGAGNDTIYNDDG